MSNSPRAENLAESLAENLAGNSATQERSRACRCGHTCDHYMVSAEGDYGFWGLMTLYIGITTRPKSVCFKCRRCDDVILVTEEDAVLDAVRDGRR